MKELDGTKYCLAGTQVSQVKSFERVDVARSSRFFSLDIFFEKVSRSSENSRFGEPFLFLSLFYLVIDRIVNFALMGCVRTWKITISRSFFAQNRGGEIGKLLQKFVE